jgi:hypothetical protein
MAAGLGVGMGRLFKMEDGTATDEDKTFDEGLAKMAEFVSKARD